MGGEGRGWGGGGGVQGETKEKFMVWGVKRPQVGASPHLCAFRYAHVGHGTASHALQRDRQGREER